MVVSYRYRVAGFLFSQLIVSSQELLATVEAFSFSKAIHLAPLTRSCLIPFKTNVHLQVQMTGNDTIIQAKNPMIEF